MGKRGPKPKLKPDQDTLELLASLGRIHCTEAEAAGVLKVCRNTLLNFFNRCPEAREKWEHGQEEGRASLRRHQFKMAQTNPAMAIWLGKQYLGQREPKQELGIGGDGDNPFVVKVVNYADDTRPAAHAGNGAAKSMGAATVSAARSTPS